jgi:hypothetical protein
MLLLATVGLAQAAACTRARSPGAPQSVVSPADIAIDWTFRPSPPASGPVDITLTLADAAGAPVRGARLGLEGDMTHPGMAPVFAAATEENPGRYRARLILTMGGDWILRTTGTLADGRALDRSIAVANVRTAP